MRDATLRYPNILFDLDGTLTDPREGITRSGAVRPRPPGHRRAGPGAPGTPHRPPAVAVLHADLRLRRSARLGGGEPLPRALQGHRSLREPRVRRHSRARSEALVGRGHTLYVATSKPGVFAREIARHFAFDRHFKAIYGSELDGTRTHKDELIRHLLDSEGLAAEHCLMIGDRMHDLLGASRGGVACIGVGYGFGSEDELRAAPADPLLRRPRRPAAVLESTNPLPVSDKDA
ncbi:HAD hydrolase-like protein [Pseudomonas aeruginosa]